MNSLIERLVDSLGHDAEARDAVVAFGLWMKESASFEVQGKIITPGGKISGQTPQHGNIEIKDDREKTKDFSHGVTRERIGYYKLWKQKLRKRTWIFISDFWKADEGTQSETEMARQWALLLEPDGRPAWFGERGIKEIMRIPLGVGTICFRREMYRATWGASSGQEHKGGLRMEFVIGLLGSLEAP